MLVWLWTSVLDGHHVAIYIYIYIFGLRSVVSLKLSTEGLITVVMGEQT